MRLRDRFIIYCIIAIAVGVGAIWLFYHSLGGQAASTPNPYDFATFLIVIAGAAVALVAQEVSGRVEIAKFRRSWTEDLRELISELSGLLFDFDHATTNKNQIERAIVKTATKALLMLTGSRVAAKQDEHANMEKAILDELSSRKIAIQSKIISNSRPTLKEGWLQAVKEIR